MINEKFADLEQKSYNLIESDVENINWTIGMPIKNIVVDDKVLHYRLVKNLGTNNNRRLNSKKYAIYAFEFDKNGTFNYQSLEEVPKFDLDSLDSRWREDWNNYVTKFDASTGKTIEQAVESLNNWQRTIEDELDGYIWNHNEDNSVFEADNLAWNIELEDKSLYVYLARNYHINTEPIKEEVIAYFFELDKNGELINFNYFKDVPKFNFNLDDETIFKQQWEKDLKKYTIDKFGKTAGEWIYKDVLWKYGNFILKKDRQELRNSDEYYFKSNWGKYKLELQQAHTADKMRGTYYGIVTDITNGEVFKAVLYRWREPQFALNRDAGFEYDTFEVHIGENYNEKTAERITDTFWKMAKDKFNDLYEQYQKWNKNQGR